MASDAEQFVRSLAESWTGFGGGEKLAEVLAELDRLRAELARAGATNITLVNQLNEPRISLVNELFGSATPTPPADPGYPRIADAIQNALDSSLIKLGGLTQDGHPAELWQLARSLDKAGLIDWTGVTDWEITDAS